MYDQLSGTGIRIELAEHRGVAVLVLAITTDHLPSQATLRALERVARRHPEGLFAVAMVGDNIPHEAVRTVLESYRMVADLQRVTLCLASEEVRAGTSALGPVARVPTMFFVNRAGAVSRTVEGIMTEAQIEALVAPAIPSGM